MTKEEALSKVPEKGGFNSAQIRFLISSISEKPRTYQPTKLKKGDVVKIGVALKPRPCVVWKTVGEFIICIPMSTTEDEMNACKFSSRFFGDNYLSKNLVITTISRIKEQTAFLGILEDNKAFNIAIKEIKKLLV